MSARISQRLGLLVLAGWLLWGGNAWAHAMTPPSPLPIANFILGGGDRHCSSFNGETAGRGCSADWATILEKDPAFAGKTMADISFDASYALPTFTYSLTATTLQRVRAIPAPLMDAHRKAALLAALEQLAGTSPMEQVTFAELDKARGADAPAFTADLTRPEVAVLRAALVDTVPAGPRKYEARSIVFASNPHVRSTFQQFVAAARAANGGKTPKIGVVTASSDAHPFADAGINVDALRSAGADVVYIPMNGGLRQALDSNDCKAVDHYYDSYANTRSARSYFHSALVYPAWAGQQRRMCENHGALLNATLKELSGIYFSGGDQARHLESFIGKDAKGHYTVISPQLAILRARHAEGKLVVAGTSAGNHVQGGGMWRGKPVPMLGGGDSYEALRAGFIRGNGPTLGAASPDGGEGKYPASSYELGGLGFFQFGLLDSHFSIRTREGRLVRLTQQSGMDYGFGIDENTALVVSRPDAQGSTHLSVTGAAGVLIVDVRNATATGHGTAGAYAVDGVRLHYLNAGDTASVDAKGQLHVRLDTSQPLLPPQADAQPVQQDGVQDYGSGNFLKLAQRMGFSGAPLGLGTTERSKDRRTPNQGQPFYSATLSRVPGTEFRGDSARSDAGGPRLSYTQLLLKFAPCSASCASP
jgi:cyanophycinase